MGWTPLDHAQCAPEVTAAEVQAAPSRVAGSEAERKRLRQERVSSVASSVSSGVPDTPLSADAAVSLAAGVEDAFAPPSEGRQVAPSSEQCQTREIFHLRVSIALPGHQKVDFERLLPPLCFPPRIPCFPATNLGVFLPRILCVFPPQIFCFPATNVCFPATRWPHEHDGGDGGAA